MAFSSDNVRVFLAVLDSGSFSAAARLLGRVPSSVSMTISQLEAELDLVLFDRTARDARPTDMARALCAAILEDPASVRPKTAVTVEVGGTDREYLLFDWLKELLYRFDAEHQVFGRFEARLRPDGLTATAWFLGRGTSLAVARGTVHRVGGRAVIATYHPSAAIRFGPVGAPMAALREDLDFAARLLAQARPPGPQAQ